MWHDVRLFDSSRITDASCIPQDFCCFFLLNENTILIVSSLQFVCSNVPLSITLLQSMLWLQQKVKSTILSHIICAVVFSVCSEHRGDLLYNSFLVQHRRVKLRCTFGAVRVHWWLVKPSLPFKLLDFFILGTNLPCSLRESLWVDVICWNVFEFLIFMSFCLSLNIQKCLWNKHFVSLDIRAVPNTGLELFGRIRIVMPTIRPNTITNS